MLDNLLCHSDIGQKHKLFNHVMSIDMLVLRGISWILSINIQLELDFWRCQSQCTLIISYVAQHCGYLK